MKKIALVISSAVFLIGCSKNKETGVDDIEMTGTQAVIEDVYVQSHPMMGYWVSDDNSYILNIEKEQTSFTFLSRAGQNQAATLCPNVEITESSVTLNCPLTKDLDFKMVLNELDQLVTTREDMPGFLKRAPSLKIEDLTGVWKDEESNGVGYTIYVTDRKADSYNFETYNLARNIQKYDYFIDEEIKSTFSEGFIFTEKTEESDYVYYVIEVGDNWYRVVDETGYSWAYTKYEGDMRKELSERGYEQRN